MAILSDEDRVDLWGAYMREAEPGESFSLTKADLRAALDAVDGWVDANAASFNTAIPQPARAALTSRQKARLLQLVVRQRFVRA